MAKAVKKPASPAGRKEKPSYFNFIKWFWILFAVGAFSVALLFLSASWGWLGPLPSYEALENPQTNLASQIISSDDELLGKFYLDDSRSNWQGKFMLVLNQEIQFRE